MRNLILLRGIAGCGKSTWIKENNLTQYTLSTDDFRVCYSSPVLNVEGNLEISQNNDTHVWELLFHLIEERMKNGDLTIIDATHARGNYINRYRDLCREYRYRCTVIEFPNNLEVALEQNKSRPAFKFVPEEVIERMHAQIKEQPVPGWVNVIKPEEFWETFKEIKLFDFSKYKKVVHIGDIHGSYEPLKEYFDFFPFENDNFYIFLGDYFDRGNQNAEVFNFLYELKDKPNVLLLEGNHEIHFWNWANGLEYRSREFKNTSIEFLEKGIKKEDLRQFYRKVGQLAFYKYNDKVILCTHGGVSNIPTPFISTKQLIKGVGRYEDISQVTESWNKLTPNNYYQIHGHRNNYNEAIRNDRCFNLNHTVEFGGDLRIVELDHLGFREIAIPNRNYVPPKVEEVKVEEDLISTLRNNKYIEEKKLENNVSSFNFTRDAFYQKVWNTQTMKARGLFININTKEIVARSYEKFFNVGENDWSDLPYIKKNFKFPLRAWVKYNGFLGIVGYNSEIDELFISSKSTNQSDNAKWFKEILEEQVNLDNLKEYVKNSNTSFVFEVIDPANDPHIIEYKKREVILLDVIYREPDFKKFSHAELVNVGNQLGLKVKELYKTFDNFNEFMVWYADTKDEEGFKYNGEFIEGFVIEDLDGNQVKFKTAYYNFWKWMRSIVMRLNKRHTVDTKMFITKKSIEVYAFLQKLSPEDLTKDIIQIRNMYEGK